MDVRWSAVFFGWLVDFAISLLIQLIMVWAGLELFFTAPDLANPTHLIFLLIFLLSTGVGGFIAGRFAGEAFALHGLLVGVTAILASMVANPGVVVEPRVFVIHRAVGCLVGALGGYLAGRLLRRA
jgi:putative membrane protein (TIGR04086 family)